MEINLLPHNLIKTNFNWILRLILDTLNSRHLDYFFLSYLCSLNGKEFCWKFLEATLRWNSLCMKLAVACCWGQPRESKKKRSGHPRGRGLVLVAMDILAPCGAGRGVTVWS